MKRMLLISISALVFCTYAMAQFPGITINPSYLTGRLLPGNDTTVTTQLINNSAEEITFSFPAFTTRGSGGPDGFGYQWIDSDEGMPYSWTEISVTGTEITGMADDNRVGPFDIGFTFPFYGQTRNQYWVNSNGVIQFSDMTIQFANIQIPTNTDPPTDFIAALWDDLNFKVNESKVFYQLFNDKLIIQYEKVYRYAFSGYATFQVALMANGTILISYKEISSDFNNASNTIGIQSPDQSVGLQVSNNEDYIHNELSVLINTIIENGDFVTTINPASGTIPSGSQLEITLTYSAAGYEPGRYQQTVYCTTSDPGFDSIPVYNLMTVSALPVFFGTVTDAESGAALEGVTVTAGQYTTTTGPSGQYDMVVAPGTYDIQFELTGYDTGIQTGITIDLDQTLEVSQALTFDDDFILGGTTFAGIYQLDMGFVNAFKSVEGQVVDIFADLIDTLGYYNFPSLTFGEYRIKAEPAFGSGFEGEYLPTYYGDVVHWADAQVINLTQNVFNADINLVAASLNNSNGPGKIAGHIYHSGETKSGNSSVPAPDIPIFLKLGNDYAMAMSNSEGYFEFSRLEYGTYTMFAEQFGKNSEFRNIILSSSDEYSEANDLFIYASDILYGTGDNLPAGVQSVSRPYPNPSTSQASLAINLLQPKTLKLELFNGSGQLVSVSYRNLGTGVNEVVVPVSNLKSGIYWLQISDETGAGVSRKLIRK
ncbi:MAG: carboxypeptidase regulatory-like domain-containing protein [Bacteroidota bacterium]